MNIEIHAKAYRSQCSSFNFSLTSFIKQARTLVKISDHLGQGEDTTLRILTLKVKLGFLVRFELGLPALQTVESCYF